VRSNLFKSRVYKIVGRGLLKGPVQNEGDCWYGERATRLGFLSASLACSPLAESLLQPCQHGLDSASSAIRFINRSGTFFRYKSSRER